MFGTRAVASLEVTAHARGGGFHAQTNAENDFSMLLASRQSLRPSMILLRQVAELTWQVHLDLLTANLRAVQADLKAGAVARTGRRPGVV